MPTDLEPEVSSKRSEQALHFKKVVAREWLIFVFVCPLFGGFLIPSIIMLVVDHNIRALGSFYSALFDFSRFEFMAWLVVLGPYILLQVGRSVWWAYGVLKRR